MSIVDTGRFWEILVINTGNTSIADTGRFWKILSTSIAAGCFILSIFFRKKTITPPLSS
jgi:hypothetical protein